MADLSAALRGVVVDWTTQPVEAQVFATLRGFAGEADESDDSITIGPLLIAETRVGFLSVAQSSDKAEWHLHTYRRPASDPPKAVLERTDRIGGGEGLRQRIVQGFSGGSSPVAQFQISISLNDHEWQCLALPTSPIGSDPVLGLDEKAVVEQIGYRLTSGPIGLSEVVIIYGHEDLQYRVTCLAKGIVEPGPNLALPYVDSVLELVVRRFFNARRDQA